MRKLPTDENGVERIPPPVEPVLNQRRARGQITQLVTEVRQYELITPLFGGGVEPGVADPVTVIRGSEIRGHLRFWWRACRGGQFGGNLARMKEAEDLLWGTASTAKKPCPSQVQICVEVNRNGDEQHPFNVVAGKLGKSGKPKPKVQANESVAPAYAAFPLQPTDEEVKKGGIGMQTKTVRSGPHFTLTITYPNDKDTVAGVEAALWAWETFGGVGARTRRGFGALRLVSANGTPVPSPAVSDLETTIRSGLLNHILSGTWPPDVPHLDRVWHGRSTVPQTNAGEAWKFLVRKLRAFRQEPLGRTPPSGKPPRPGRSRWPEPDAIRRLFPSWIPPHTPSPAMPDKFPRAAFGLPIVFKFKSEDEAAGDPTKTMLEGQLADRKRFASPLILRPLACSGGQAVGLAIILHGSNVPPLVLKDAPGNPAVQATLSPAEAGAISPLSGNVDILQAFLNTL
jgi:CRISPR-associated protein Cmr1